MAISIMKRREGRINKKTVELQKYSSKRITKFDIMPRIKSELVKGILSVRTCFRKHEVWKF